MLEVVAGLAAPVGAWSWPSGIWVTGRPVTEVVALLEVVVALEEVVVVRMVVRAVVVRVVVVVARVEVVVAARVEVVVAGRVEVVVAARLEVVVARVLVPVELLLEEEEVEAGREDMAPVPTPGQEIPMVALVPEGA